VLSVKAFPSASVLAAGGWPCSAPPGRVGGRVCRAWVHHPARAADIRPARGGRFPGASASRRWMSWRGLAARLGGPAVSER